MTDLARDPVFGEVARRLSPLALPARASVAPTRPPPAVGGLAGWVEVSFRTGGLGTDELARLAAVSKSLLPTATGSGRDVLGCPRFVLEQPELATPAVAALLAAHERANLPFGRLRLMGVVNVTPDSFSDGGEHLDPSRAVARALALVAEGADLLDIGGESTRPGSDPVSVEEELRRVVPVITELAKLTRIPISTDTRRAAVARAALEAGATIVNDVSAGLADAAMLAVVAKHKASFVAMHMQGEPRTMQTAPRYDEVVAEVANFLRERCFRALEAGIARHRLWIDPGIGFGKTLEHNLELLRRLPELRSLGLPILLGVSRKSFIPKITGVDTPPEQRIGGTAAAVTLGVLGGAEILRVHDVAVMREAALVARAIGIPG
ncbi:MAG: dihydropteroate synthase [Planctomycetota bacterium]|nr:dihydropteroate synthase [Planctomycetota bacterium]